MSGPGRKSGIWIGSAMHVPPLLCIIALLAGCGTIALKPEPKLVSSVTSLPPVAVPLAVRCVKEVPPIPDVRIDQNATPLQKWYMLKETVLAYEAALIEAHGLLLACAAEEPKP